MFNPFDRRAKTAPSHYPRPLFHAVRFFQLISSLIVGAIMCYFMYELAHDKWGIPWTFIWLTAASLFSVVALAFTIVLHCFVGLRPRLNMIINGFLLLLWTLSWSLLTWYMSGTLANLCDVEHWTEEAGIMVCRIYKALFTFTLLGFISTAVAFGLDIYVHRSQTRRGVYRLHDIDTKRPNATRGPFTDDTQYNAAQPRESEAWEAPRPSIGPYEEAAQPLSGGYAAPEEQFRMDRMDTGYHGGQTPPTEKLYGQ